MAITDINISEELETGAPSIKYRGNEGPKSPEEEMQMADALLREEYDKYVYDLLEQRPDATPMSFEEFRMMVIGEGQLGSAQPPMANRQMAAFGGIMDSATGRRRYGIGSRLRKLIPNEVARVAEVAAPFVAPFNPIAAGLMGGLGSYDRTGNLMGGVKRGLLTYGGGQLARGIGGGMENLQGNPFKAGSLKGAFQVPGGGTGWGKYFSSPIQDTGGIGKLWADKKGPVLAEDINVVEEKLPFDWKNKKAIQEGLKKGTSGIMDFIDKNSKEILLGSMGLAYATAKPEDVEEAVKISRGTGLDIDSIRAEVQEALAGGEAAWAELQKKYPYVGEYPTKGKAEGGIMRAGYYAGGQSIPSEYTIEDARKTAMQDRLGGITEVMKQADLYRQGDVGQMYMNQGGRIGAQEGGIMDLGGMEKDYRNTGGFVDLGAEEKADDVPARLSVNEFVMTADAVRGAGDGDIDKGAQRMEDMMKKLEGKGKRFAGGGERGWKAQMRAMEIAEEEYGRDFYDLNDALQHKIYNRALQEIDDMLMGRQGASDMFEVSERLSAVV